MERDFTMPLKRMLIWSLFSLFLLMLIFAQAEEPPTPQTQPATQIITDGEQGVIRFLIGGKETMRLDETGLHVFGDLSYNGTVMDGTPPHMQEEHIETK